MSTPCLPSGSVSVPEAGKVVQPLLSRLYSKADRLEPGMGSEAVALSVAALYQLFEPSVPLSEAVRLGFCISSEAFCVRVRVFPALSRAMSTSVCPPSLLTVMELHEPSVIPSSVQVKLANPEVASEALPLKETGVRYQPFDPAVPLNVPVIVGCCESTLAFTVPIVELSPYDDNAQKVKLLLPSFSGTLQVEFEQAKVCPLLEPSMARIW